MRRAILAVVAVLALASANQAVANEYRAGYKKVACTEVVVCYETRTVPYTKEIVKYDHCGKPYTCTVTCYKDVEVAVKKTVTVYKWVKVCV